MLHSVDSQVFKIVMYMDAVLLVLTVILMIMLFLFRLRSLRLEKQRKEFYNVWLPLLEESLETVPEKLPKICPVNISNFLVLWNGMQNHLLGEVKENLNQVARQSKIDVIALTYLQKEDFSKKLLGINAVGHLREVKAWAILKKIVQTEEQQLIVLMAAKALAEIDEWQAAEVFIPLVVTHKEWSIADVGAVLEKMKPAAVAEVLCKIILCTPAADVPRMLRFLRFATPGAAIETVLTLLKRYNNVEIIAGCLSVLADCDYGENIALARSCAGHSNWVVRLQAVHVLSKIGTRDDIPLLLKMLTDKEWWVRHRSARALLGLSFLSLPEIEEITAAQTDKYALDALNQALVEKRIVSC